MAIKIVQTCDRCERERLLKVTETGRSRDILEASLTEKWASLYPGVPGTHLCGDCAQDIIKRKGK